MRKLLRNAMMLSAMAGTLFFTACDNDGEDLLDSPTMTVTTDPADGEVAGGESISFTVEVNAPGGFNTLRLQSIESADGEVDLANYTTEYTRTDLGLDAGATSATVEFESFSIPTAGEYTGSLLAVDDANNQTTQEFTFSVTEPAIESYETVLIGGYLNNTTGSFYDAVADSVFAWENIENIAANRNRIDMVYYYVVGDNAVNAVLAAPNNPEAGVTWNSQTESTTWPYTANSNATMFKQAAANTNFDFLTSNADLAAAYGEVGTANSRITNLTEGALVAFQIDDARRGARYGVAEVTNIGGTVGSSRSITLNVKIQSVDNN